MHGWDQELGLGIRIKRQIIKFLLILVFSFINFLDKPFTSKSNEVQ